MSFAISQTDSLRNIYANESTHVDNSAKIKALFTFSENFYAEYTQEQLRLMGLQIGDLHTIPDSLTNDFINKFAHFGLKELAFWKDYRVVDNPGINYKTFGLRESDVVLAKYAEKVADKMSIANYCYTGTKHALWAAGVIEDYGDMPKGSAHQAIEYFDKYPEKFQQLDVKAENLKDLPAGVIIVYSKEGEHGHIAITTGNGVEMSDSFDNMKWVEEHGEGASFKAYKLTDAWKYNPETKKLEFEG